MPESIRIARTDEEIAACFPAMRELRDRLDLDEFMNRVRNTNRSGTYSLVYRLEGSRVVAVAGFRILENFAWGRFLYVDDLVTMADARSKGHGAAILRWLEIYAAEHGCAALHLDSGMHRRDAHRFYDREGFARTSIHFAKPIDENRD